MHRIFFGNGSIVVLNIRKSVRAHCRNRLLLQQALVLFILSILFILFILFIDVNNKMKSPPGTEPPSTSPELPWPQPILSIPVP